MPGWYQSPLVLALAGTLAIHTIVAVAADAVLVAHPLEVPAPAPHVSFVDVKIEPAPPPTPPPPTAVAPPVVAPVATAMPPAHHVVAAAATHLARPAPVAPAAPAIAATAAPSPEAGGDGPVVSMDDIAPAATGVAVAAHAGGGGAGTGPGRGPGPGAGDGTEAGTAAVSIAAIKTRALPRKDYGYYESKDYPAEARRLGIEGTLRVKLLVSARGQVTSASLLDHLGHGLDELALARARTIEFTPARDTDDRPVASVVIWTFHMTLPR